jgi:hypothetical protein
MLSRISALFPSSPKTAKALDISRCTLIRYLKADEELRNSFDDVKLNEIDDVRSALVKLALPIFSRTLPAMESEREGW